MITSAVQREDATFASGRDRCAAWLYRPVGPDRAVAIVVMAHGLSGTRRDRLGAFAERFAAAGFAALAFDHRGFGDSEGEPDRFEPSRQLEDWSAAIAYVRSLPGVDPARVATFGSSMGGGNALAAAANDRGVAAAISQVPFLDLSQAYRGPLRVRLRMLAAAVMNGHLPAVGRPDQAAFINAPDSEAGWRHVVVIGEDSRWRNRVSARWIINDPFRRGRYAATLQCPWLVCVGDADQVAHPAHAIAAATRAPRGELRVYPGVDHFDIYDGPEHEAVVGDQLEFLQRHLAGPMPAPRTPSPGPSAGNSP
jgi:alpha-beta hydrolase superfamily lysophospholipase